MPERTIFLRQLRNLSLSTDDPYLRVYPSFLGFFNARSTLTADDFVLAANFVYGWMPTILQLEGTRAEWAQAATLLIQARRQPIRAPEEIDFLKRLINNSAVGASKLLHFANPEAHAIWDSRVCRYLTKQPPHQYRVNNAENLSAYYDVCEQLATSPEVDAEARRLSDQAGHRITKFRAIELTMWKNGGAQ